MSDDTLLVVCEKCGARLRIKAAMAKMFKDVKCSKCGARVPVKKEAVPLAAPVPPAADVVPPPAPAPEPEPAPAEPAAAPAALAATPPPVAAPPVAAQVTPVPTAAVPAESPSGTTGRVAEPVLPATPATRLGLGGEGGSGSLMDEVMKARSRVRELEQRVAGLLDQAGQLAEARTRVAALEVQLEKLQKNPEIERLRHEAEEQAQRVAELQQLWMAKEKEVREAYHRAEQAQRQREEFMQKVRVFLVAFQDTESRAAQRRLADLQKQIDDLVGLPPTGRTPPA